MQLLLTAKQSVMKSMFTSWEFISFIENNNDIFLIYNVGMDEETGKVFGIAEDGPAYLQNSTCERFKMERLHCNGIHRKRIPQGKIMGTISYDSGLARLDCHSWKLYYN